MEWTNSRYLTLPITRHEQSFPVVLAISSLSLPELQQHAARFLHPEEHTTLTGDALHHYLSGRLAAKLAAAHFTHHAPASIQVRAGVFGQPLLHCPGYANVQVSIAHSGGSSMAVVFPEGHPMAVDIEDTRNARLLPPLKPSEAILVATQPHGPLLLWTAREALSKVLKTGLTTDLEILGVASADVAGDFLVFTFEHFMQYKAISWVAGHMVCSLVLPLRSEVDLSVLTTITYPVS